MAVELATLAISAFRNFSGSRRYGLVSMSGFCAMGKLYQNRQTLGALATGDKVIHLCAFRRGAANESDGNGSGHVQGVSARPRSRQGGLFE